MAKVGGPCFSTWASGQLGKTLIYGDHIKNQHFTVQIYHPSRRRPTRKQRIVREIFGNRGRAADQFMKDFIKDWEAEGE